MSTQSTGNPVHCHEIINHLGGETAQVAAWAPIYQGPYLVLKAYPLLDTSTKMDPVSRIGKHIHSTRPEIASNLSEVSASFLQTNNRSVAGFNTMPHELIVEIFTIVVKAHSSDFGSGEHRLIKSPSVLFYRRLKDLQSVCTHWRDIIRFTRRFWSVIPLLATHEDPPSDIPQAVQDRVTQCPELNLMMHLVDPVISRRNVSDISKYLTKIRTVRICATIRTLAQTLLERLNAEPSLPLSELSICLFEPGIIPYLSYWKCEALSALLPRLQDSLRVLRIWGTDFTPGDDLKFSRLTQLRIQRVILPASPGAQNLLSVIGSAPFLRILEVISVSSVVIPFPGGIEYTCRFVPECPIMLPHLEELYLEDLYLDLTNILAHSIASTSHRLILNPTRKIFLVKEQGHSRPKVLGRTIFDETTIDTLVLRDHKFDPSEISILMLLMNQVQELHLDHWGYKSRPALLPWTAALSNPKISIPPKLYLTRAVLNTLDELVSIVRCHYLQHLTLGGVTKDPSGSDGSENQPITSADERLVWIKNTVPSFSLVPPTETSPEISFRMWRLWEYGN